MTGAHNFFRLYALVICDHAPAPRLVEDFDFVSEVPHSNNHTVGTAIAGKTMTVHPRSLLLYCTAMFVYVYQTTTFPPHYGDNEKVKTRLWISPSCSGAGVKQWLQMTGALYIAHARIQKVSPEGVQLGNVFF